MEQILLEKIGKRIRAARKRKGLTQEQLGEKIDTVAPHISNIENGKKPFSLELLIDLCNALEVTPTELLDDALTFATPETSRRFESILEKGSADEQRAVLEYASFIIESKGRYKPEEKK